jgi:hypothetical protein
MGYERLADHGAGSQFLTVSTRPLQLRSRPLCLANQGRWAKGTGQVVSSYACTIDNLCVG